MSAQELNVFVEVTLNFFAKLNRGEAEVATASIQFKPPDVLDFTGLISVSGSCRGHVYVTLPRRMLEAVLAATGEPDRSEATCLDCVGEMANVLAANCRKTFGRSFRISTPSSFAGRPDNGVEFPYSAFVLPFRWQSDQGMLVISMEET